MSLRPYHEESLRLPATEDAASAATKWDWGEVLLDHVAYMVDKKNHTSADLRFKRNLDGKEVDVQVSFCFAKPPRVSYFCCHAYFPDDKGEDDTCLFFCEPYVFATDGDLALIILCIGRGRPSPFDTEKSKYEYIIYKAATFFFFETYKAATSPAGSPSSPGSRNFPPKCCRLRDATASLPVPLVSCVTAATFPHMFTPRMMPSPRMMPTESQLLPMTTSTTLAIAHMVHTTYALTTPRPMIGSANQLLFHSRRCHLTMALFVSKVPGFF